MRVKILEDVKHDGSDYLKDDELTVTDDLGAYFCENGWAKDASGTVTTAKRDVNRTVKLDVQNIQHGTTLETK